MSEALKVRLARRRKGVGSEKAIIYLFILSFRVSSDVSCLGTGNRLLSALFFGELLSPRTRDDEC